MFLALVGLAWSKDRALDPGDLDVRVGWSTTPRVRGAAGWALWGVSWWETGGGVDVGLHRSPALSLSLGLEAAYSRPWLTQGFVNGLLDTYLVTSAADLSAEAWSLGARGKLIWFPERVFQPTLVLGVGRRQLSLGSQWAGKVVHADANWQLTSWHVSPGTGFQLVLGERMLLSWEGRWSRGRSARVDTDGTVRVGPYDLVSAEGSRREREAPRGLTWSFALGMRF